jgi:5-methylcytosine-specific restriction endonuclease McrA
MTITLAIPQRQSIKPDSPQEHEWYITGRCRNCGKELDSHRHYCDSDCNIAYWQKHAWVNIRLQVFRRDSFRCAHCGFQVKEFQSEGYYESVYEPIADPQHWVRQLEIDDRLQRRTAANWVWDHRLRKRVFSKPPFVADHIKPIALGGDEWDLNNLQSLCIFCNKVKTRGDSKNIAKERRVIFGRRLKVAKELQRKHGKVTDDMLCMALNIGIEESHRFIDQVNKLLRERPKNPFAVPDWAMFWRYGLRENSLLFYSQQSKREKP